MSELFKEYVISHSETYLIFSRCYIFDTMQAQLSYLLLFFLFVVFLIALYLTNFFISVLPKNSIAYTTSNTIYTTTRGLFDNSFILIFFVVLFIDLLVAYYNPSVLSGILNIFLLFAVVYIVFFMQNTLPILNNVLSANTILPTTYGFLSSTYIPYIVFMFLIGSIILNFRHTESEGGEI